MVDSLISSIIALGFDIFSIKLYLVACSTLWLYDYMITFEDEVEYAWRGEKTPVFWLFIMNRYLAPCFIIMLLTAYFTTTLTVEVCNNLRFVGSLQTLLLTTTAQIFITIRVYAITNRNKLFPCFSAVILTAQWGICVFAISQSFQGLDQTAVLLFPRPPPFPTLPDIDAYRVCLFISAEDAVPYVKALLCLCLVFDASAFFVILFVTINASRQDSITPLLKIIQRDGVLYFFVLFSSNILWVLLLIYARMTLKFMHNSPAMIFSAIMINRITLHLRKANQQDLNAGLTISTFGPMSFQVESQPGRALDAEDR